MFLGLEWQAIERLSAQGVQEHARSLRRMVEVRFARQTKAMELPYHGSVPALLEEFLDEYARRYGETAVPDATGFELVTFVVLGRGAMRRPKLSGAAAPRAGAASPVTERPVYDPFAGEFLPTPIYTGEDLRAGDVVEGPAVIQYATTTLAVCSGQRAEVGELLGGRDRGSK